MIYRWHLGTWAHAFHRISGLALTLYLTMHIYVVSSLQTPEGFNKTMTLVNQPMFKLAEIALWGAILYHSLNGFRLLLVDLGWGVRRQKPLFAAVVIAGIILFLWGAIPMFNHAFHLF